jgi:predicted hydrolase (HD superfamily)
MIGFESLAQTEAEQDALERLRSVTGVPDGPMERHCLRCRRIAAELARTHGWVIDGEVLTVAAILHDIGLYPAVSSGGVYTRDGADLARAMLPRYAWTDTRIERCADAIDRHHELRSQLHRGPEVEALRRADLIDVSGGLIGFGIDRTWLRRLSREVPRRGFGAELAREVGRALRERPMTLPRIFLRS